MYVRAHSQLAPLRYAPRCALLPLVVGSLNKGYIQSEGHFNEKRARTKTLIK